MLSRSLNSILKQSLLFWVGILSVTAFCAEGDADPASLQETVPVAKPAAPPSGAPLNLSQILKSTVENSGQIKESQGDIEIARAQLSQARAAMWPRASAIVLAAPIFEERGNAVQSTQNWNKWGPFVTGGLEVVQPIFTFGQISNYKKAAENQILAREGQADMKKNDVIAQAKEFYYGMQMARALEDLVGDLSKFLEEAVESAEEQTKKKKKKGEVSVKPHDLFKLKTTLDDLKQKKLYAKQAKETAERAVSWISGVPVERIQKVAIKPEPYQKKTLEEYLALAKDRRPEFKALAHGKEARASLRDAKKAANLPVIFIGGFFQGAWSPVRDRQLSNYANDPFNRINGGAGLGLKWDLEIARHNAEAAVEEGELMKLQATETYAVPGIELQVRKAYGEFIQAVEGMEVAENRRKLGKKWFVSSAMGWTIGLTAPKDLLESLEGDGLARKNYIETVYSLNLALAKLSQAVGVEVSTLSY